MRLLACNWHYCAQFIAKPKAASALCFSWVATSSNLSLHTPFNGPLSRTTRVSRYQKGTNLDFTEARDSEWQWHQLGHMHVCTLLQTDNHASTSPLSFLQAGCPSCCPTNSVKALKAKKSYVIITNKWLKDVKSRLHIANTKSE